MAADAMKRPFGDEEPRRDFAVGQPLNVGVMQDNVIKPLARRRLGRTFALGAQRLNRLSYSDLSLFSALDVCSFADADLLGKRRFA